MVNRDGKTPQEQKNQILAIQPIFPGSQPANTKYTIPPYHPHIADDGNMLVDISDETPQSSFTPTSSDALAKPANAKCIPLIPTPTGARLDRMKDQDEGFHGEDFVNTKGNNSSLLD